MKRFETINRLRQLLSRREQWHAVLLLAMMLGGAVLEMVGVGAIPAFIALLSEPARVERYALAKSILHRLPAHSDANLALWGASALLAIFLVKNVYLTGISVAQARYITNRQVKLAGRLFRAYLNTDYTLHLQRNSAELLRNATNEAMDVIGGVLMPGLQLTMEFFTVAAILGLLLYTEPFISFVAFTLLGGATFIFVKVFRKRLVGYGQELQYCRMKMYQTVNEGLGSLKVAKVLGRERHFLKAFTTQADRFAEANRFRQIMLDLPRLYLETAAMLGLVAVAGILLIEKRPVQAIIPTLSLLAVAVVRMIPSFNRITSAMTSLRYGRFSLNAVYQDLMELDPGDVVISEDAERLPFRRSIQLEDVSFTYPGASVPSLRNITLDIRRGTAVAFVGPTGSGKTTLVDLVLGLLKPTTGRILIDDVALSGDIRAWQRHLGYVPQDVYLMDESIRKNVAFGLSEEEIDDDAVRRALDAAQLTSFVASLPEGVNSTVGERGVRLSGGQRQRIGIARALYHNPDVLVLDEATSALDSETERYVMQAVEHLRGSRTIIVIAHRMTTVKGCDELFLLSDGELAASGQFETLLDASHRFKALVGTD